VRSPAEPEETKYKKFEVAPTGEWCDLAIDRATMNHDWEWMSGMRTETVIDRKAMLWRAMMRHHGRYGSQGAVRDFCRL
jgi:hypothetical protein